MKSQVKTNTGTSAGNILFSTIKGIFFVSLAAVFTATLFTAWPATGLGLPFQAQEGSDALTAATPTPDSALHIGLVVGHWGHDAGAVCPESLGGHREVDINYNVAELTRQRLQAEGIKVDLLKEFDDTLDGYEANAIISIHADTCEFLPENATGFKIAETVENKRPEQAARLTACLKNRYANATGLRYDHRITADMTSYHAFREVHPNTPAVIIETGFMNQDRELLTKHPEQVARGITDGIMCYLNREEINPGQ